MLDKKNLTQEIYWQVSKKPVPYEEALNFMQKRVDEIINNQASSMIWTLQHPPVYTAGISAKDSDMLQKNEVPIFKTNRGGKYTYHCPGMQIIYVMLDLKKFFAPKEPDVASFVNFLESWVIAALENYKIKGEIRKDRVGIWVENKLHQEKKIAALGIKIKKWVSYHGIAINVNPDLSGFQNIVPCGISEFGVTSIAELGIKNFENFDEILFKEFEKITQKKLTKIYQEN